MPQRPRRFLEEIRNPKKRAFLAAYAHTGRIVRASKDAQVHWGSHYLWLKEDEVYAAAFEEVKQLAADFLEDEAVRRAYEGIQETIFYQGHDTGHSRTVFSDTLLIFLLKGAKPDTYKDVAKIEHTGTITLHEQLLTDVSAKKEALRHANGHAS